MDKNNALTLIKLSLGLGLSFSAFGAHAAQQKEMPSVCERVVAADKLMHGDATSVLCVEQPQARVVLVDSVNGLDAERKRINQWAAYVGFSWSVHEKGLEASDWRLVWKADNGRCMSVGAGAAGQVAKKYHGVAKQMMASSTFYSEAAQTMAVVNCWDSKGKRYF